MPHRVKPMACQTCAARFGASPAGARSGDRGCRLREAPDSPGGEVEDASTDVEDSRHGTRDRTARRDGGGADNCPGRGCFRASGAVGGTDRSGLRERGVEGRGHRHHPARDHREAWPAPASRHGSLRRARAGDARREAGVRDRLPAVLLWPDLRGAAPAGHRRLQRAADLRPAAGDGRRDGAQRHPQDRVRQRPRRQQQLPALLLPVAVGTPPRTMRSTCSSPRTTRRARPRSGSSSRRRWTCTRARSRPRP